MADANGDQNKGKFNKTSFFPLTQPHY